MTTANTIGEVNVGTSVDMYVIFGRPGAGKTTVANAVLDLWNDEQNNRIKDSIDSSSLTSTEIVTNHDDNDGNNSDLELVGLDLDVCVPQSMKDNFANGIYPTLEQRLEFANDCCHYIKEQQKQRQDKEGIPSPRNVFVISFSFVNVDLRDVFRASFPNAIWILIDTTQDQADERISQRTNHFYTATTTASTLDRKSDSVSLCSEDIVTTHNGDNEDATNQDTVNSMQDSTTTTNENNNQEDDFDDAENSDWNFAPVTFPHIVLNGSNSIKENALTILSMILK